LWVRSMAGARFQLTPRARISAARTAETGYHPALLIDGDEDGASGCLVERLGQLGDLLGSVYVSGEEYDATYTSLAQPL